MSAKDHHLPGTSEFKSLFFELLSPEQRFYKLVLIYSIAISLLTLAIPISIQSLIDTIANIGLVRAIVVISIILFGLLLLSGVLYALRAYILELFNRRIFIRLSSEMAMCAVAAREAGSDERQRLSLFNRFFDIMTLKKNLPHILTNGFSLVLQSFIGFIVVSLYHLYFFLFAMVLVLLIWVVWKFWGWRAITTGFMLSEAKYETADYLQSLSISLRDFKATGNVEYILEEFDEVVHNHIDCQEKHFAFNYKQLLSLLFINALASAVLLGMGGWLVIQGELTLGQLVAAELIMLGIFAGLPPLAGYLEYFYDICAAVEEISRFNTLPQESISVDGTHKLDIGSLNIQFRKTCFGEADPRSGVLDFELNAGEILRVSSNSTRNKNLIKNSVIGNVFPTTGEIYVNELATREIDAFALRKRIKIVDRSTVIPGSIRHYMMFSNPLAQQKDIRQALELVGMAEIIDKLTSGLDTKVSADGFPLSLEQTLRLKLAATCLSDPAVIILDQISDLIVGPVLENIMKHQVDKGGSVISFSERTDISVYSRIIEIDHNPAEDGNRE